MFEKNLKPKRPKLKENELLFAVREPFQSIKIIKNQNSLTIESLMPTSGIIFSDGIEEELILHMSTQGI